jgi:hypothetical protein
MTITKGLARSLLPPITVSIAIASYWFVALANPHLPQTNQIATMRPEELLPAVDTENDPQINSTKYPPTHGIADN